MATYFVRKTGSNSNAGTSAGAAWLTIGKALGAAGIASGDTVYIGAGVYREVVSVAMTSPTATTYVIGDVDGVQTGDAGEVQWTGYTTNDKTAPSGSAVLDLNTRNFLTISKITFVAGAVAVSGSGHDITVTDCSFLPGSAGTSVAISISSVAGVASNWTITRCTVFVPPRNQTQGEIQITLARHTADYNAAITISNSLIFGNGHCVRIISGGSGTGFGGGVLVLGCTLIGIFGVSANDASLSSTIPCRASGNLILAGTGITDTTAATLTEDHNLIVAGTARTNVAAGTGSISNGSYAPLVHVGQELQYGASPRPFGMPTAGSPLLGFGNGTGVPAVDILNAARPSGGAVTTNAVGAYERGNSFGKETGTVRTGSNALSITGPGYQDFSVPVSAAATTLTIYGRYDSTYAGTLPSLNIINGTECGVANATATMAGAANAWEALTLTFTPTAAGIVTVRLLSSDTNGGGEAFMDDWAVT